nr:hypothetical protein [Candidatus Sigynarchaeota archaeon]
MKATILLPADHNALEKVASDLKQRIESKFKGMKVSILDLDEMVPDIFLNNQLILIGTPTVKNDIYWPIQVKIDGMMHKILKNDFSSSCISAFTIFSSEADARQAVDALLWTFHETTAKVVDGLCIIEGEGDLPRDARIDTFLEHLKRHV